jgi:hypothetical protein
MAKRLDETRRHNGVVPFGGKGDDFFEFNIPADEQLENVKLEVLSGCWNIGARIEKKPRKGATGPNQRIKVHWWFDGGSMFKRGYIRYRIRAFTTVKITKRAIVVPIENTGRFAFTKYLSGAIKEAVEGFIDTLAEYAEENHTRQLFSPYYAETVQLVDENCTKDNIRAEIARLGKHYVVDLGMIGHGGTGSLELHDGKKLTEADVEEWKDSPEFQGLKLGLVYMTNCKASTFNSIWTDLGFKTSIGAKGDNYMPEPMFTYFWTRFMNGETAKAAARKSWLDAKRIWQFIYVPSCRMTWQPMPPFFEVECEANDLVLSSKPKVGGDKNYRFTDTD